MCLFLLVFLGAFSVECLRFNGLVNKINKQESEDVYMIYLRVNGGLGNQMFQYAVGYYMKKKYAMNLCIDTTYFDIASLINKYHIPIKIDIRTFQLERLNIEPCSKVSSVSNLLIDYVFKKRGRVQLVTEESLKCRENQADKLKGLDPTRDIVINGYWQNLEYVKPIEQELRKQLTFSFMDTPQTKAIKSEIIRTNSVGVHIRRGDFVKLGWDKNKEYYLEGMRFFRSKFPDCRFFLFSDDPQWALENIASKDDCKVVHIDEENGDLKEFELLKMCKKQIISESTFGWWAAFLNTEDSKVVYVPQTVNGNIWSEEWMVRG